MPTALVVGAGLSGLAAAHALIRGGWTVTVLERDERPGGRVRTERRDGFVIDTGPDAISTHYTDYLTLVREVGLERAIVPSNAVLGLVRAHRLHDIDTKTAWRAAFSPVLSWRAKAQLAFGATQLFGRIRQTDAFDLVREAPSDDPDRSAHDLSLEVFGREATECLIDPLVRLVTGTQARQATTLAVPAVLSAWSAPLVSICGGLDSLPMRLAQMAGVTLRSDVLEVVLEGSSVVARWRDESGHSHDARFDAAIIATQLAPAMRIAPDLAGRIGDLARQITRLSLLSVTLAFERQTRSRAYAVPLSSADFPDQLLMFLQHNKAPDRAPPGKSLVTFYIDHQAAERWFELTDGEIERRSLAFALPLLPELEGSFLFSQITRWPQAGSLAGPGYYRVVREIVARLEPDLRLQLAGDFFAAGSMETAVRSGRRAAERLMAQVSRNS